MAQINRTFTMDEPPETAQRRFDSELGPSLHRMGFKKRADEPGHLHYGVRYLGAKTILFVCAMFWVTGAYWLVRKFRGDAIRLDFTAAEHGTTVEVYGRASGSIRDLVDLLGRNSHWPTNLQDPDWLPNVPAPGLGLEPGGANDGLEEWDDIDQINPAELDRITRRALKKAGRLQNE